MQAKDDEIAELARTVAVTLAGQLAKNDLPASIAATPDGRSSPAHAEGLSTPGATARA